MWIWVNLSKSEQVWRNLNDIEPIWVNLGASEWIWTRMSESERIWTDLNLVWTEMRLNERGNIWVSLSESERKSGNLKESECDLSLRASEALWVRVRQHESDWIQARLGESEKDGVKLERSNESKQVSVILKESVRFRVRMLPARRMHRASVYLHIARLWKAFCREAPLPTILLSNFSWLYR